MVTILITYYIPYIYITFITYLLLTLNISYNYMKSTSVLRDIVDIIPTIKQISQ